MDKLIGKIISVNIQDQYDWKYGNLTGVITSYLKKEIAVKRFRKIKGSSLRSLFLIISPRYENESFELLMKQKNIPVGCALTNEYKELDYIAIGIASLL